MADNTITFKVDQELKKLGKDLEALAPRIRDELSGVVADLAKATYAQIIAKAQMQFHKTRLDYLRGLNFLEVGPNDFLITLDGTFANMLEDGRPPYNLTEALLKSKKVVEVGSRAGEEWVQKGAKGQKFARVPIGDFSPMALEMRLPDLKVLNPFTQKKQNITGIFRDFQNNIVQGKVGTFNIEGAPSEMQGLTKYQQTDKTTGQTKSLYLTYRTISENGKQWNHPGIQGARIFEQVQKELETNFEKILDDLFSGI